MNTSSNTSEHDEKKRILVLGSSGYSGIDSTEWDAEQLPNIVDYDIVIVDVPSLDEGKIKNIQEERLREIRYQLVRFLHAKGQLIVITYYSLVDPRPGSYPKRMDNYDWCPVTIGISNKAGNSIVQINDRFESYIKHLTNWSYFLFIPKSCLSFQLTDFYGSTYRTKYATPFSPILTNRYDKVLAGSFVVEVRNEKKKSSAFASTKYYSDEPDSVTGEIVLLPHLPQFENKEAIPIILKDLTGFSPPSS